MTLSTSSIPADIQRKIDDEDLCHVLLEHCGMEDYSAALNFASGAAKGRVAAILWQAIFQHLLVRRRNMCIQAKLDFYETEKKAEASVKRLKATLSPELTWLMVYLCTRKICIPQSSTATWDHARGIIGSWPGSQ